WDGIQAFREAEIPQLMSGPQEVQDLERTETNRALIKAKALAEASNDPDLETHRIVAEGNFVIKRSRPGHPLDQWELEGCVEYNLRR
ncbi:MAG: hypothetical protein AAFO91_14385, partial [Bacteroidota bacterium]